jgi:hypothetical protein
MDPRDYQTSRLGRLVVFLVVTLVVTALMGGGETPAADAKAASVPTPTAGSAR